MMARKATLNQYVWTLSLHTLYRIIQMGMESTKSTSGVETEMTLLWMDLKS